MGIIRDMQRAHATQAHAHQRSQTAVVRQRELIRRNADLAHAAAQQAADAEDQRERRRLYGEARAADVASANADLSAHLHELDTLLHSTLDVDDHIDLDRFKKPVAVPPFDPGPLGRPLPEPAWQSFAPTEPTGINKILGGDRLHQQQVATARRAYEQARERWIEAEARRRRQLAAREQAYAEQRRKYETRVAAYNAEVDRFAQALAGADPASVIEYFAMVLGNSVYPDHFPQHYRLAFLPLSRQLLIEYHLPSVDVVPAVKEYRYDRVRDDIVAVPRGAEEIRRRYTEVIAQVALRTVHEIVEADRGGLVEAVLFNGIVDTIDRRTGRSVRPCLVSLKTDRDTFAAIKLRRVDPIACLRHLEAGFSAQPDELTGVQPVVDFDAADTEYRDEVDVLADLDNRPDLVTMPAQAYESLLADLFGNMGLDMGPVTTSAGQGARWTAVDPRPLFGGKVVVYAVRAATVGAAAAHSLAGAVAAAGATKGILVTTGGYEPAAHEAVAGRPLELIDGSGLLHLLADHSRIKARIDAHTVA
jgi:restriction system protein